MKRYYVILGVMGDYGYITRSDGWRPEDNRIRASTTSDEAAHAAARLLTDNKYTKIPDFELDLK